MGSTSDPSPSGAPWSLRLRFRTAEAKATDLVPNTGAYQRLATLWDAFHQPFVPRYGRFLAAAGAHHDIPVQRVLDLACGTGLVTRQLARRAHCIVGLDISVAMLRQAYARGGSPGLRYVRGDFRRFCLNETFDAAVCAYDSLNYLETPGELTSVFRCVRQHLRPGGLFVFDVLNHKGFLALDGTRLVVRLGRERFEIYYFYDPVQRVSESRLVLQGAIERHRRIPIDGRDVRTAAAQVGMVVAEHFSFDNFCLTPRQFVPHFYVLRRPED
jgi:SAM-dependent methyltransferase